MQRIAAELERLRRQPRPSGAKVLHGPDRLLRVRVGRYRIVYQVDDVTPSVRVVLVGHRRDVYRRLGSRR